MERKRKATGWTFLLAASVMIFIFSFYPMISALITSFKTGSSANMKWAEPFFYNYARMFNDKLFMTSVWNTFLYLIVEVPIIFEDRKEGTSKMSSSIFGEAFWGVLKLRFRKILPRR